MLKTVNFNLLLEKWLTRVSSMYTKQRQKWSNYHWILSSVAMFPQYYASCAWHHWVSRGINRIEMTSALSGFRTVAETLIFLKDKQMHACDIRTPHISETFTVPWFWNGIGTYPLKRHHRLKSTLLSTCVIPSCIHFDVKPAVPSDPIHVTSLICTAWRLLCRKCLFSHGGNFLGVTART